jgi:hypothetical protein
VCFLMAVDAVASAMFVIYRGLHLPPVVAPCAPVSVSAVVSFVDRTTKVVRGLYCLFLAAGLAVFLALSAGAWSADGRSSVSSHHTVGDLIGFPFLGISGVADRQLGLDYAAVQEVLYGQISGLPLQGEKGMSRRRSGRRAAGSRPSAALAVALSYSLVCGAHDQGPTSDKIASDALAREIVVLAEVGA